MEETLTTLEFSNAVTDQLRESLAACAEGKRGLSDARAAKVASLAHNAIVAEITPTPSVRDINVVVESMFVDFMEMGLTVEDLGAVESFLYASFGFTGRELDTFIQDDDDDLWDIRHAQGW